MTVATQANLTTYTGNSATVAFATGYPFVSNDSLIVTLIRVATGERSQLVEGVHYSVAGAGVPAGGTVTTLANIALAMLTTPIPASPLSSSFQLEIRRSTPAIQQLNLTPNDPAPAEELETSLDRLTMALIDQNSRIADVLAGVPSSLAITNGIMSGVDSAELVASYSGLTGTTHKLRQSLLSATPLRVSYTTSEVNALWFSGLIEEYPNLYITTTPDNSGGGAALQLKNAGFPLAMWDTTGGANETRWGFGNAATSSISFAAMPDDLSAVSEFLRWTRSGATAVSTQLRARLDANSQRIGAVAALDHIEVDDGTISGTTKTVDWTTGNVHKWTMGNNVTFTFTAPAGPATLRAIITQDGTGNRTMTLPASVKWTAATAAGDKLLSTAANKRDLLELVYTGSDYLAKLFKDF